MSPGTVCIAIKRACSPFLGRGPRQVAYVTYDQHLIYVEPHGSVASPPKGEPLEVDTDSANYRCLIKALTMEAVWWDCLADLHCEALPGCAPDAPKLPEDVLAVLAMNGAWYHHSRSELFEGFGVVGIRVEPVYICIL